MLCARTAVTGPEYRISFGIASSLVLQRGKSPRPVEKTLARSQGTDRSNMHNIKLFLENVDAEKDRAAHLCSGPPGATASAYVFFYY